MTRAVYTGTSWDGPISSVLWEKVTDGMFQILDRSGMKVVVYEHHLVILTAWVFPPLWERYAGINPTKTELTLFSTKPRVPEFRLPRLNGKHCFFPPM